MPVRAVLEHSHSFNLSFNLRREAANYVGVLHRTSWNKGYSHVVSGRDLWDYCCCGTALEDFINIPQALADVKCFTSA